MFLVYWFVRLMGVLLNMHQVSFLSIFFPHFDFFSFEGFLFGWLRFKYPILKYPNSYTECLRLHMLTLLTVISASQYSFDLY